MTPIIKYSWLPCSFGMLGWGWASKTWKIASLAFLGDPRLTVEIHGFPRYVSTTSQIMKYLFALLLARDILEKAWRKRCATAALVISQPSVCSNVIFPLRFNAQLKQFFLQFLSDRR